VRSDRFRPLLSSRGPFASVYFDDSHDTEDAGAQLELRWRAIEEQLQQLGVDTELTAALQSAFAQRRPAVGDSGAALIGDGHGVMLDEHLLRSTPTTIVRVSPLPYIIPVVEHGLENHAYLVVSVDHAGADITVHRYGHRGSQHVDGGGYPVHRASSAESSGYGDPQARTEEAVRKNVRAVAERVTGLVDDDKSIEVVFVVGEVRSRSDLSAQLPERVAARIVDVNAGARAAVDEDELARQIDAEFMLRRVASMDDATQRFVAELGRGSGLATEGLPGVCAALRDGSVETLIIGEIGDATVVLGDGLTTVAPNADVLSEMGGAPVLFARADEALPLAAVAVDASLVRTDERIAPKDGVAAVLRFAARR
jgi:peptide chain release factor subunit 1